jgi:hypothetical protein
LHGVETADPALRARRTAWRRIRRVFAEAEAVGPVCPALRKLVRSGYRMTPEVRRALQVVVQLQRLDDDVTRRLRAASKRLEALGVPHDRAAAFAEPDFD